MEEEFLLRKEIWRAIFSSMEKTASSGLQLKLVSFLESLGADMTPSSRAETADRFERHLRESLRGYQDDPTKHLKFFDTEYEHLISVKRMQFSSICEHHLLPFYGYVDICYVPSGKILGLSKFARIVAAFSRRLQVQEHLTKEMAEFLYEHLQPKFLGVTIEATHTCMVVRGVEQAESTTTTQLALGDKNVYDKYKL